MLRDRVLAVAARLLEPERVCNEHVVEQEDRPVRSPDL
jgi:hypothetical protein